MKKIICNLLDVGAHASRVQFSASRRKHFSRELLNVRDSGATPVLLE